MAALTPAEIDSDIGRDYNLSAGFEQKVESLSAVRAQQKPAGRENAACRLSFTICTAISGPNRTPNGASASQPPQWQTSQERTHSVENRRRLQTRMRRLS